MNGGLVSPNETKHHLKLGGRIRPNGATNNVMNGFTSGLLIIKDVINNPSNIFIDSVQHFII